MPVDELYLNVRDSRGTLVNGGSEQLGLVLEVVVDRARRHLCFSRNCVESSSAEAFAGKDGECSGEDRVSFVDQAAFGARVRAHAGLIPSTVTSPVLAYNNGHGK